ncbi:MAG: hypothetical protein R6U70_07285, partial [Bacillota bacterium]
SALIDITASAPGGSGDREGGDAALRASLEETLRQFDYHKYGGAALLGVRSMVIKCHGSSGPRAITSALGKAHRASLAGVPDLIERYLAERSEIHD